MSRLNLWVRSEQLGKTSQATPILAGKGVGGLGFLTHIFKLDGKIWVSTLLFEGDKKRIFRISSLLVSVCHAAQTADVAYNVPTN